MSCKTKIDIFKVMSEEELRDNIKSLSSQDNRFYQRLIAMSLIQNGVNLTVIAKSLHVNYSTLYRWAKACESMGVDGLEVHFNGGKWSDFTQIERKRFTNILKRKRIVTIRDAQRILKEDFGHDFSIGYVGELVRSLGFEYNTKAHSSKVAVKTLVYQGG